MSGSPERPPGGGVVTWTRAQGREGNNEEEKSAKHFPTTTLVIIQQQSGFFRLKCCFLDLFQGKFGIFDALQHTTGTLVRFFLQLVKTLAAILIRTINYSKSGRINNKYLVF